MDLHSRIDPKRVTLLHVALSNADEPTALILLQHKANVNQPNRKDYRTPLNLAVKAGCSRKTILELLRHGAYFDSEDVRGKQPYTWQ